MTEQDKQALIKHFCERDCGEAAKDCPIMPCWEIELIQEFPATETDSDTISRAKAIEAIEKCHKQCCREDATGDEWIHYETTVNEVESVPPAEPQIIRCKDCGYRDEFGCCKYWVGLTMGIPTTATDDEDFCSCAKRREVTE